MRAKKLSNAILNTRHPAFRPGTPETDTIAHLGVIFQERYGKDSAIAYLKHFDIDLNLALRVLSPPRRQGKTVT